MYQSTLREHVKIRKPKGPGRHYWDGMTVLELFELVTDDDVAEC